MYDKKENNMKKRGLCLSICAALVCGLGIGGVYYKMNKVQQDDGTKLFSDSSAGTKDKNESISKKTSEKKNTNKTVAAGSGAVNNIAKNKKKDKIKTAREKINDAKSQENADKTNVKKEKTKQKNIENKKNDKTVNTMSSQDALKFDAAKGMIWPVGSGEKDVILKFSGSNTVYFKTLAQYKVNPAIIISAKTGEQVKCAASGVVKNITTSDETGNTVTVDIGSGYEVIYGQIKDLNVKKGQKISKGDIVGHIAKPTKYYTEEGSNLYFEVRENGKSVDPLLLLK